MMLSRLVITFLPRSKRLCISWLQSPSAVILEPPQIISLTVYIISPSICHEVMGPDAMIFVFWMLSFKPTFSLSSFTFFKRLFSSSSLSARRVVSSGYLKLLIFLLTILIPACASSSLGLTLTLNYYSKPVDPFGKVAVISVGNLIILLLFFFLSINSTLRSSLVAQTVKYLPAVQETQVRSLDWEDPLEKGIATHSSILAWRIPWTEEPSGLQSIGLQRVRYDWSDLARTHT